MLARQSERAVILRETWCSTVRHVIPQRQKEQALGYGEGDFCVFKLIQVHVGACDECPPFCPTEE